MRRDPAVPFLSVVAALAALAAFANLAQPQEPQAGPADPVVAKQAEDIYRYAKATANRAPLATWTEDEREYHARSMELAVLQAAKAPLDARQIAEVKAAIDYAVRTNYPRTAPETLKYQRELWAWLLGDIIDSPPARPEDAAELERQLDEVCALLADELRARFNVPEAAIEYAIRGRADDWVRARIADPFWRFDRKPLTPEALQRAQALMLASLDEQAERLYSAVRQWNPTEPDDPVLAGALTAVVYRGLQAVVHELCGWREAPVVHTDSFRKSGEELAPIMRDWRSTQALAPLRLLLDGLLQGTEAAYGLPGRDY
jgi:hypothetical protein